MLLLLLLLYLCIVGTLFSPVLIEYGVIKQTVGSYCIYMRYTIAVISISVTVQYQSQFNTSHSSIPIMVGLASVMVSSVLIVVSLIPVTVSLIPISITVS